MDHAMWEINQAHDALTAVRHWLSGIPSERELDFIEYETLKFTLREAYDLYGSACEDITALKDEMEEWRDNMGAYFSATQKYREVDGTATLLADSVAALERVDETVWAPDRYRAPGRSLTALDEASQAISDLCSEIETTEFPGAR